MKKKELFRLYNFSDGKLVTIGKEKIAFMRRDLVEFEKYGIKEPNLEDLETRIDGFLDTETDVEAVNTLKSTTTAKDTRAEELRVAIREVMARVILVFEEGSPNYKKFGTEALSQQLDSDLLITSKRVVRVANEFLAMLAPHGVTTEMINVIVDLRNKFEDLIVDVKVKIGERDTQQQLRVEKGNAIYEVLAKYCGIGINIWTTKDVAKYNDYVIYNTTSGDDESNEEGN